MLLFILFEMCVYVCADEKAMLRLLFRLATTFDSLRVAHKRGNRRKKEYAGVTHRSHNARERQQENAQEKMHVTWHN
jgi:hypothetical protein